MRMTDLASININANTLGGMPSDYFMSSWTSLQYQVDDWNDEKRTRVYSVGSGDFKLANAPTDCYNYGLFLSFFTRTSTWGIQFYFPHNQNNYDLESYKPRFRICQSQIWTPWKILNTESLSQIMLENINNMEINKLNGGGYGGTLGFSSIEAASLLPSLMALTEQKGGQHENDRHRLDPTAISADNESAFFRHRPGQSYFYGSLCNSRRSDRRAKSGKYRRESGICFRVSFDSSKQYTFCDSDSDLYILSKRAYGCKNTRQEDCSRSMVFMERSCHRNRIASCNSVATRKEAVAA